MVLVTLDKKLEKLFEYSESGEAQKEVITIYVNRGENKIIKVGYDADVDIDISLDADRL
ncbi:hypothetical protein EHE19_016855 [Ruminiclostridium herbifermentans]|uniref:Uncharacterized protein n=1 Tax=Ruminiclostridium herbifermentans TaxID=2488810 RepID=A0A7H1VM95_9FIRM|nr:hypothetical protein [Ruminiclostridium herbifermentans]QNU66507.1 hypothetical protein EHE19_016855 [Ruminiclostridium herbifermentans]